MKRFIEDNKTSLIVSLGVITVSSLAYLSYKQEFFKRRINPLPQTQNELVDLLHYQKRMVLNRDIVKTLRYVDRKLFLDEDCKNPYYDEPKPIGYNATISAPHMHAVMLDYLAAYIPKNNGLALDIGSGSGFVSACLADLMGATGKVVGVEHIPELVDRAKNSINKLDSELLNRIEFKVGDGIQGYDNGTKYDVIYLGAAIESLGVAATLIDQLKQGGRMIMPVGKSEDFHELMIVDKDIDGMVSVKSCGVVRFVPLVKNKEEQLSIYKSPNQTKSPDYSCS
ncbi:hypothetical protein DICPUDRAFT_90799 [Dictyostelium purpureum]|uniref:protein-L-isoaspartate(D-aspartate) O-methyltransferase n=1 Tax=Dictyostelium purpureum TaxID=5786 RepID=F1A4V3_DICPU|nr:uncharacterized protein DICPUDRAFT_90799 [Dictyostelium purpureum]EGC28773.1 hypothetical protein DICPUDRAFT_90799 [Dictyostelium purpureum]|eukprot:XP_003294697.1 hypothetical protein DICPUDRAFT_90799 [Dictyostelium purpureum]